MKACFASGASHDSALVKAYSFDNSQMGNVFAAGGLGTMFGGLLFGPLGDHVGRRRAIITATFTSGVLTLLLALSNHYWELLSVRLERSGRVRAAA
jgi:AAHS family 4-hydroxybenzoate transporter-like MFS transporter